MLTAFLIPAMFFLVVSLISYRAQPNFNKLSPYECGFNAMDTHRASMPHRYYNLCILFILFDIEIVLLFPMISSSSWFSVFLGLVLIVLLIVGLVIEWVSNNLEWKDDFVAT